MTLNYPHEGLVVPKANAVVGGSKPVCEIPTWPDGKLHHGGKSLMCVSVSKNKNKNKNKK